MKKSVAAILCLIMMLSLASCSGGAPSAASPSAAGSASAAPETPGKVYEITYAGTVPDTHPMMIAMNQVAEEMEKESNGQLVMTVYPNNQLGDSRANVESMQGNSIQAGELSIAVVSGFSDLYNPLSLPFFFSSSDQAFKFFETDFADDLADKCADEVGVRPVAWFLNGIRSLTNSKRAVTSPDDMKGLKIRVMENPIYIKSFEAMGASATPMSFAEVFTGLQQKTIDGQDNPRAIVVSNKFYEVQSYFTDLGHTIDMAPIMVSEEFYESLPADLQEMFVTYMQKAADIERDLMAQQDADYLKTIETTCQVTILTDEQRAVFKDACSPVYDWFKTEYSDLDLNSYLNTLSSLK